MKTTLEILREARELISVPERWTKKAAARSSTGGGILNACSPEAAQWCAIGAIRKAAGGPASEADGPAIDACEVTLGGKWLALFNDENCHADVLRVFDETIARLEKTP